MNVRFLFGWKGTKQRTFFGPSFVVGFGFPFLFFLTEIKSISEKDAISVRNSLSERTTPG